MQENYGKMKLQGGVTASPCSLQCRPARGGTEYRVLPFSFLSERGGSERRPPRSPSPGWCKSWFDSRTGGQPERAKQNQRKRGEVSDSPSHVSAWFFDFSYLVSFVLSRQARKAYKTRRWPRRTAIYALVAQKVGRPCTGACRFESGQGQRKYRIQASACTFAELRRSCSKGHGADTPERRGCTSLCGCMRRKRHQRKGSAFLCVRDSGYQHG